VNTHDPCPFQSEHDWQFVGGTCANCSPDCSCSVPVSECTQCGDCDYGHTVEADKIILACKATKHRVEMPACPDEATDGVDIEALL